jgi:hypothetical protein
VRSTTSITILREGLQEVLGIIDEESLTAPWTKRIRKVASQALFVTAGKDELRELAGDLAKSLEALRAELAVAAHQAKAGCMWTCIDVPKRLLEADDVLARAKAAGVHA